MIKKMRWCDKCNSVYEEGSQSPCALGACEVNLRLAQHAQGVVVGQGAAPREQTSPDALIRLITNLSTRLANIENSYKLLEQMISGQELVSRRLAEMAGQHEERVGDLEEAVEPVTRSDSDDLAARWETLEGNISKHEIAMRGLWGELDLQGGQIKALEKAISPIRKVGMTEPPVANEPLIASDYDGVAKDYYQPEYEVIAKSYAASLAIAEDAAAEYQAAWEDAKWQSEYWKRLAEALGAEGGVR